ncbi:hypothetical protein WJX73_007308 [Symbiochloris irregularis]|uniref:Uncharacterized protein n=1 Tax=Symbiochloris irregularis TaxID=706552 RepID=A0AAW1P171_9CHLO
MFRQAVQQLQQDWSSDDKLQRLNQLAASDRLTVGELKKWLNAEPDVSDTTASSPEAPEAPEAVRTLWDELHTTVQLDPAAAAPTSHTKPAGGGTTAYNVLRWNVATNVEQYLAQFRPQLEATPSKGYSTSGLADPSWTIIAEHQVYSGSAMKLYAPVNACLEAAGLQVRLLPSHGEHSRSDADTCAEIRHRDGSYRYLPGEAQSSSRESDGGAHLHTLLGDEATQTDRDKVEHVASQELMYMVIEGSQLGLIVSHTSLIGMKRVGAPSSKDIAFTDTIRLDSCNPYARAMLFSISACFEESSYMDPQHWPESPDDKEWVRRAVAAADSPHALRRCNQEQHAPLASRLHSHGLLPELPECPLPALLLGNSLVQIKDHRMVRLGSWEGRTVVFKLWDTYQCINARAYLQREWLAYHALRPLQGHAIPKLEAVGSTWAGGMIFLVLEYAGSSLSGDFTVDKAARILDIVGQLHEQRVMHNGLDLRHFVGQAQQILELDADSILDDIADAVFHYHDQAFDAAIQTVLGDRLSDAQKVAFIQGCKGVYAAVHADLTQRLQQLATAAKAGPLHVPSGLIIPQAAEPEDDSGLPEEDVLDQMLAQKRAEIRKARRRAVELDAQAAALEEEIEQHSGTRHLTQLTSSLMGKENLAQDASTLVDLGLKLQQAMAHAQELRQARLASGADEGCNVAVEAERAIIRTKALHGGLPSDVMHSIKASLSVLDSNAVTA